MNYYFYDSKSPWAIVLSDINDTVTLNVGINQISSEDLKRIDKVLMYLKHRMRALWKYIQTIKTLNRFLN